MPGIKAFFSQSDCFNFLLFGWRYVTQPAIEFVNFNTTMDTAAISFRLRYEFGETIYVRSGNEWKMISSKLTGIE